MKGGKDDLERWKGNNKSSECQHFRALFYRSLNHWLYVHHEPASHESIWLAVSLGFVEVEIQHPKMTLVETHKTHLVSRFSIGFPIFPPLWIGLNAFVEGYEGF